MKKKISLLLSMVMMISSIQPVSGKSFIDTNENWAREEINTWSDYEVVEGFEDGTFKPAEFISRGEVAMITDKIMKYKLTGINEFDDLTGEEWYAEALLKNIEEGNIIVQNNKVNAREYVTREEAVAIISRTFEIEPQDGETDFIDNDEISNSFKGYVKGLYNNNYIYGRPGNIFAPNENITRAEVVKIIDNIVEVLYAEEGTYAENVAGNVVVNTEDVIIKDANIDGNLFVTAGVGEGDLTLENVLVTGDIVVEGGGEHSIKLTKGSKAKRVKMQKNTNNAVRLYVDENSDVENVEVDGEAEVILEGNGSFGEVTIDGENDVTIANDTEITKVIINNNNKLINNGIIKEIIITLNAENIKIIGNGKIIKLTINSNGKIDIEVDVDTIIDNSDVDRIEEEADKEDSEDDSDDDNNNNSKTSLEFLGGNGIYESYVVNTGERRESGVEVYSLVVTTTGSAIDITSDSAIDITTGSSVGIISKEDLNTLTSSSSVSVDTVMNYGKREEVFTTKNKKVISIIDIYNSNETPLLNYSMYVVVKKDNGKIKLLSYKRGEEIDTTSPEFRAFSVYKRNSNKLNYKYYLTEYGKTYSLVMKESDVEAIEAIESIDYFTNPQVIKDIAESKTVIDAPYIINNNLNTHNYWDTTVENLDNDSDYVLFSIAEDNIGNISETVIRRDFKTK